RDGEATSFPPPTQGFAALAILALLDGFDVANLDDADYVDVIVEATKLAFEDRDRYLADPTMVTVPVERCLDAARLARRRSRISRRAAIAVGGPPADGDTIAIVTADAQGNAVSVIQSTYHEFGAAVVAGGTGVLLQNRGAFFSLDPGHPNALAPRKRTAHTLIPSIYMVGGRPRFVYGTMGGEGQPQTQAATAPHSAARPHDGGPPTGVRCALLRRARAGVRPRGPVPRRSWTDDSRRPPRRDHGRVAPLPEQRGTVRREPLRLGEGLLRALPGADRQAPPRRLRHG